MNLHEAQIKLLSIRQRLEINEVYIVIGSLGDVGNLLEECNSLLAQESALLGQVERTRATASFQGTPLLGLQPAYDVVSKKIMLLESLSSRTDLVETQRAAIQEQLKGFRSSRDTLRINIERCLHETELLE